MPNQPYDIHQEIIRACQKGEESAFYRLYSLYSRAMYNTALRIVKSTEEAEDVLQESFISAFRNIGRYRGDSTFGAWLKRIVINKSISSLRKDTTPLFTDEEGLVDLTDQNPDAQEELNIDRIKSAIENLPNGYRVVLSLYLIEGYDHQEIAEILHITVSTSKSQYNRAKARLRKTLSEKEVRYG